MTSTRNGNSIERTDPSQHARAYRFLGNAECGCMPSCNGSRKQKPTSPLEGDCNSESKQHNMKKETELNGSKVPKCLIQYSLLIGIFE